MTRGRCKQFGAALLLGSVLLWFGLPLQRTTAPTPSGDPDLQWYLKALSQERMIARRQARSATFVGIMAGAGLALLAVGCLGARDGRASRPGAGE
jgi:hypothetical protein